LQERIRSLCGNAIADALHELHFERDGIILNGYVGNPSTAQHTRGNQYLFLNGRAIVSRSLNFAISQVYEPFIAKNTFPFFVINLSVNPESVDVNIHPQKHEVKFDNERALFSIIQEANIKSIKYCS
jgi:DNA mismatch repair protein MutL